MKPLLSSLCALLLATLSTMAPVRAEQTIKIATVAPEGSAWMRELRAAGAEVQTGTQGRVLVKFYPGGVMGSDLDVMRDIRLGQLQGGMLTSSALANIYPDAPIYSLPFLFDSWAQVDKVRPQIDPLLAKGFDAHGMHMLAASSIGFAYIMGTRPLHSRADMDRAKLWIPQNDVIAERTFKMAGISTIPLPLGDVFTSLQTGLVDTVANTPSGAVALQWHGKVRSMIDLPLTFVVGYVVLDGKAWHELSPADQAVVGKAFAAAAARMDAGIRHDDAAALDAMKKQGLVLTTLDPAEAARWRDIGAKVTQQMVADKLISADMLAAVHKAMAGAH
ncbi:MAG TPA: TRAP transporter substrate-binding protein DctP [Xanthomonadaceae bacterium]|nr:TRAP transporter substrate-binding protein DctP [Xanthomonadaceae bacterium]